MTADSGSSISGFCTFSNFGTSTVFSTTTGVFTISIVVLPVFLSVRVISYSSSSTTCFFSTFGLTGDSIESSIGAAATTDGFTITAGDATVGMSSFAPEAAPIAADFGSTGAFSRSSRGAFTTGTGVATAGVETTVGATTTGEATSYLAPEAAPMAADFASTGAFSRSSSGAFTTGAGLAAGTTAAGDGATTSKEPDGFGTTLFLTT